MSSRTAPSQAGLDPCKHGRSKRDYERLEFLGDRVLGLIIAEQLYRDNPGQQEGPMARGIQHWCAANYALRSHGLIGLQDFVQLGSQGEPSSACT